MVADAYNTSEYRNVRIASQAYTIGDGVYLDWVADAIDVLPFTASGSATKTTNIYGVAMQTVASTATTLLVCLINSSQRWQADTTNNTVVNDNYQRMIVGASASLINNTHTDDTSVNAIFQQIGVVGALTAKRIVGRFLIGTVSA